MHGRQFSACAEKMPERGVRGHNEFRLGSVPLDYFVRPMLNENLTVRLKPFIASQETVDLRLVASPTPTKGSASRVNTRSPRSSTVAATTLGNRYGRSCSVVGSFEGCTRTRNPPGRGIPRMESNDDDDASSGCISSPTSDAHSSPRKPPRSAGDFLGQRRIAIIDDGQEHQPFGQALDGLPKLAFRLPSKLHS